MAQDSTDFKQWSEQLKKNIWQLSETAITKWCDIVRKTGVEDSARQQWTSTFIEQLDDLYKDMIDDATVQQTKFIDKVEALLKRSSQLCRELGLKIPDFGSEELSLSQEYRELALRVQEYEEQVNARKLEIAELNKHQDKLCNLLGKEPKIIPESPLPTKAFINEISNYIETLEMEKFDRTEKFLEIKSAIVEIAKELQYEANLNFEKIVLSNNDRDFTLTDQNMNLLEQFYSRMKDLHESLVDEMTTLIERMKTLWDTLSEDVKTCTEFLQKYGDKNLPNLEVIKQEVRRLDKLKKANIEKFVKALRLELEQLWNTCHFTQQQRNEFEHINNDCFTEDLLTLHDLEIQKVKHYYAENQELFNLLEKRQDMWACLMKFEERVHAPDRFKNRGGQLLKEEKDRTKLSKQLPTIEKQLLELAYKYEERTGVPFTSWGKTVIDIIENDHKTQQEEKLLKLSARKRDKTLTPGKSALTLSRATSSQNIANIFGSVPVKRKCIPTPDEASKRTKLVPENNNGPKTVPPKVLLNDKCMKSHLTQEGVRIKRKYRRLSQEHTNKKNKENHSVTSSDYDTFEKHLVDKENWRSTLFVETAKQDCSSIDDVVPLPVTPVRPKTPSNCTPRGNGTKQRTPVTASKFSAAPSLRLEF